MPTQDERPRNTPDPAESRERADPSKEAGLGQTSETRNTPVDEPDRHDHAREQSERRRERAADELTDQSEGVDPTDHAAHGGHRGQSEAEAIGKVRKSDAEQRTKGGR